MVYKTLIGSQFERLHPKLKERYLLQDGEVFEASGIMETMRSGPMIMQPLYHLMTLNRFLIPESGSDIPFTLKYYIHSYDHQNAEVIWERAFQFPNVTRLFTTNMKIDLQKQSGTDYLGEPAIFNSNVRFDVTNEGFLLMRSLDQHIVLGNVEIPVPQAFAGKGVVIEGYDHQRDLYTIEVSFYNKSGPLVMYKGTFQGELKKTAP